MTHITLILNAIERGDAGAADQLLPLRAPAAKASDRRDIVYHVLDNMENEVIPLDRRQENRFR